MSNENNPATPPQGATPGSDGQNNQPQNPPATPVPGTPPEGQVTISTKEYANLQRAAARQASADRRNAIQNKNRQPSGNSAGDPDDPISQELETLRQSSAEKDRIILREGLKNKVRDILDKDEYKAFPKIARDLILKDPTSLSKADNEEEALLDIEDYVREQVAGMVIPTTPQTPNNPPQDTPPPKPSNSAPNVSSTEMEDTSRLRGDARAMATFRNTVRAAGKPQSK